MEFDIKKFLVENKLTRRSLLEEDSPAGGMLKTDSEQDEMNDEEEFGDQEDSWYEDDSEEVEQEPSTKDIKKTAPSTDDVYEKQAELKALEAKKDALIAQLNSGAITIDQYKTAIGNVPTQIKKLRAAIDEALDLSIDEDEAEF